MVTVGVCWTEARPGFEPVRAGYNRYRRPVRNIRPFRSSIGVGFLVCLVGLIGRPLAGAAQGPSPARTVAIGDIHGDLQSFKSILEKAGLVDASGKWTGGNATLVQTGDYLDRGVEVGPLMDFLISLEAQARSAGGRALVLLGNHEVMNLLGETRDVNPAAYATFADSGSQKRLDDAWAAYQRIAAAKRSNGEEVPEVFAQSHEAFVKAHPVGYIEYREALGPRGKYGAWLRKKSMVAKAAGSIFLHAGIPPAAAPPDIEALNDQLRDEIQRMDRFVGRLVDAKLALPSFTLAEVLQVASAEIDRANKLSADARAHGTRVDRSKVNVPLVTDAAQIVKIDKWLAVDPENAMWWRGTATLPDDPSGGPFTPLLARYGAARFVTGHTPTAPTFRITVRFGGRVVLIDTGMNRAFYSGRASALEIADNSLTAIYEDGRTPLTTSSGRESATTAAPR